MTPNDVLRSLRYSLNVHDYGMIDIFALTGVTVSKEQVVAWLKKDEDAAFQPCDDVTLATFLNGLIIERRGRKDGEQPVAEHDADQRQGDGCEDHQRHLETGQCLGLGKWRHRYRDGQQWRSAGSGGLFHPWWLGSHCMFIFQ